MLSLNYFLSCRFLLFLILAASGLDIGDDLKVTFEIYDELSFYAKIESAFLNSGESKTYAECIINVLKAEENSDDTKNSEALNDMLPQLKTRIALADELCRIKEYWIPLLVGLILLIFAILCCCCVFDIPCCGRRKVSLEEFERGSLEQILPIIH